MAKGISIHVGVNTVRSSDFDVPTLRGCENDATAMYRLARNRGFTGPDPIWSDDATFERVVPAILKAADELEEGDIFLFTFAGHGGQMEDEDWDENLNVPGADPHDETILLSDRMILDDFLGRGLWSRFAAGVRVLMVSDSCHSGTLFFAHEEVVASVRAAHGRVLGRRKRAVEIDDAVVTTGGPVMRKISDAARRQHREKFSGFYEDLLSNLPSGDEAIIKASVLLLAACEDGEETADDYPHGVFTKALLEIWNDGSFTGNYEEFKTEIGNKLAGRPQTPMLTPVGQPNAEFRFEQRPFSI